MDCGLVAPVDVQSLAPGNWQQGGPAKLLLIIFQHSAAHALLQANGAAAAAAQDGGGTAAAQSAEPANEAEVLKRDLAELPPEAPLEAYEAMPVDKFGEALLR